MGLVRRVLLSFTQKPTRFRRGRCIIIANVTVTHFSTQSCVHKVQVGLYLFVMHALARRVHALAYRAYALLNHGGAAAHKYAR